MKSEEILSCVLY